MTKKNKTIISSIVHGYKNLKKSLNDKERPSLLVIKNKQKKILKYIYPRNPSDFREIKNIISGEIPSNKIQNFKKLPRFVLLDYVDLRIVFIVVAGIQFIKLTQSLLSWKKLLLTD